MKPRPGRYYVRAVWHHDAEDYTESFRLDDRMSWPSEEPDSWGVYYTDMEGLDRWTEDHYTLKRAQEHAERVNR